MRLNEAEIAKFTPSELYEYEDSLKSYRDVKNSIATAREEGKKEGLEQGLEQGRQQEKIEIARNLLKTGMSLDFVAQATGLSSQDILDL